MNIGACTKDLKGGLEYNLAWLAKHGFQCLQIWKKQLDEARMDAAHLLKRCAEHNLFISAVGAGPNLVDPLQAESSIQLCKQYLDLSVELGCAILCAETKMLPTGLSRAQGWGTCEKVVSSLCAHAESIGAVLAIECAGPCFIRHHLDWLELKRRVNSPALKVNFDAANLLWAEVDEVEACRSLVSEIVHTHIKDFKYRPALEQMSAEQDQDCVLGTGIVNYKGVLSELKRSDYQGCYCIEMHTGNTDRGEEILASKINLEQFMAEGLM